MTRTHQLEETLKSLSLSGMLDTLEARLAQAHAGELGHAEFLQVLCEDEVARRSAAALERRLRAARFEATCTIEEFDFSYNEKTPAALIRDLSTLRFLEFGESVVLHGPVGVTTTAGNGLQGETSQTGQSGVYGVDNTTTSPYAFGLSGQSQGGPGVWGRAASGNGVYGTSGSGCGVYGLLNGSGGAGVYGAVTGDTTLQSGVYGNDQTTGAGGGYGVYGTSTTGTGVYGTGGNAGVYPALR